MRKCLTWLCCFVVVLCLGQVVGTPPVDEWRWRDGPVDDPCTPVEPSPEVGLVLDEWIPKRDNYWGCLWVNVGEAYQQRITVNGEGFLARIDVSTGGGSRREPFVTHPRIGITLSRPWVEGSNDEYEVLTFMTVIESNGDIWTWDKIDISHLGWYVYPGDQITLHFWPQEKTCMGYNSGFCENYSGGEMWLDGSPWMCKNPENAPADISFRLWLSVPQPASN